MRLSLNWTQIVGGAAIGFAAGLFVASEPAKHFTEKDQPTYCENPSPQTDPELQLALDNTNRKLAEFRGEGVDAPEGFSEQTEKEEVKKEPEVKNSTAPLSKDQILAICTPSLRTREMQVRAGNCQELRRTACSYEVLERSELDREIIKDLMAKAQRESNACIAILRAKDELDQTDAEIKAMVKEAEAFKSEFVDDDGELNLEQWANQNCPKQTQEQQ